MNKDQWGRMEEREWERERIGSKLGRQAPPLIMSVSVPRQAGRLCLPLVNLITGRQQLLSTPNTSIDGGFVMLVPLEQTCLAVFAHIFCGCAIWWLPPPPPFLLFAFQKVSGFWAHTHTHANLSLSISIVFARESQVFSLCLVAQFLWLLLATLRASQNSLTTFNAFLAGEKQSWREGERERVITTSRV